TEALSPPRPASTARPARDRPLPSLRPRWETRSCRDPACFRKRGSSNPFHQVQVGQRADERKEIGLAVRRRAADEAPDTGRIRGHDGSPQLLLSGRDLEPVRLQGNFAAVMNVKV